MLTVNVRPPLSAAQTNPEGRIRFYSPGTDSASGYGRLARTQMDALNALPVSIDDNPDYTLSHPGGMSESPIRFTMWEPDDIPLAQRNYTKASALIVPCTHNAQVFRKAKYRGAIHVVPLYGDAPVRAMPDDSVLRFLCIARENGVRGRKGIDNLLTWFKEAFQGKSDVALSVKQSPSCFKRSPNDARISMIYEDWPEDQHYNFMAQHHCGVYLSGLEGWNMPACEMMAMGRPSMTVQFGGPADFVSEHTSYVLPYEMVPAPPESPYFGCGYGASPTREGVIEAFRSVYANRGVMRMKAEAGKRQATLFTKALHQERLRIVVGGILGK